MGAEAFDEALAHHQAGRIGEAEAGYRRLLARRPDHADSLHLLGLISAQEGDVDAGVALIRRSIEIAPAEAPYHNSLALALGLLGRAEEGLREYRTAASLRPTSAEIQNNLATALRDLGYRDEALAHYRMAAERAPGSPEIWYNLANVLAETGSAVEAETCFRRTVDLKSDFSDAHGNFGRWLMLQGRWAEAELRLTEAVRLAPRRAPIWNNLGLTLHELGRADEEEACYRRAIALDPSLADAHYNLGCLLFGRGCTDDAIACHEAALAADPCHGAGRLAVCMAELPILYGTESEIDVRRGRYARALDNLASASLCGNAAVSVATAIGASQPFFLPYQGEDDRALQAIYGQFACRVLAETDAVAPLAARPRTDDRIRIGIVSGFFSDHTIFKLFLEGWLSGLDRSRFEVIGFHTGRANDAQTARAITWCEEFVQGTRSGTEWRSAVTKAAPHVLLYPEVGIDPVAARLAAQRLARLQCVAWGHPDTTGMPTLDYFLSSDLMEPPDGATHYTERLVRLPNLGLCYVPETVPTLSLDREALGMHPSKPIFWSGQALYKYLPQYDTMFPRIAAELGPCQFVFIGFAKSREVTAAFCERLVRTFAAMGLDARDHCLFLPPMPQDRFIAAVGLADVVLDTPGWSGGKSTLDCLAQDPVIVTLPGRFMRGRHTAAILRRIGCEATIAASLDEYVGLAVRLGLDSAWRAEQRAAVARGKSRAYGDTAYLRALEQFLVDAVARS